MTEHDDRIAPRIAPQSAAAIQDDAPMFNRAAWLRILPFAAYMLFIVIGDALGRLGVSPEALRWLYPVKILVVTALLAAFWGRYHELSHFRISFPQALTAVAVGVLVL